MIRATPDQPMYQLIETASGQAIGEPCNSSIYLQYVCDVKNWPMRAPDFVVRPVTTGSQQ